MKLYLSSFRLGDHSNELVKLVGKPGAKVAVSVNAKDHDTNQARQKMVRRELDDMQRLGFDASELDLRDYFGSKSLVETLATYDAIWLSGGNAFLLLKALRQSGFDEVIKELIQTNKLVYAGYSAALCAISPSLRGVELVDEPQVQAEGYNSEVRWDSFGLIDFYPIVHFRSDHSESALVEKEYEWVCENNIVHKTMSDGDVYVVDGPNKKLLSG